MTHAATHLARGLAAGLAVLASAGAWAGKTAAQADADYRKEVAACNSGTSQQDRKTCLREAGAARDEARRAGLTTPDAETAQANALERCKVQPAGEKRTACEQLARGAGTVSGSVAGGGDIKELVTVSPAPAASAASAP